MTSQHKRESFEGEESLSLSGFPVSADEDDCACKSSDDAADEFEFQVSAAGGRLPGAGEAEMCVADEVFFQGQILPLRPSVSSDRGFLSRGASRRSESLDQYYSSAILGLGFHSTSRSSSSSRSSSNGSGLSRSHSSNNFYALPSPTPRIRTHRKTNADRRSASSAPPGWGIFRLGIARAPEIELHGIMLRRPSSGARGGGGGVVSVRTNNAEADHAKEEKPKHSKGRATQKNPSGRGGLICRCSPEAVEPVAASTKQKAAEARSKNLRLFAWLHQRRSFTKAAAAAAAGRC